MTLNDLNLKTLSFDKIEKKKENFSSLREVFKDELSGLLSKIDKRLENIYLTDEKNISKNVYFSHGLKP